ncbi:hypothetical protein F4777DRAFT_540224 [Nemania sp. FL0916]|nr:hypothetical protein F4777DRAFT_540224 [Nemania sp. FL0916]
MHNTKVLLSFAVLADLSMALAPSSVCDSQVNELLGKAPTPAPALASAISSDSSVADPHNLLGAPQDFVHEVCSFVAELPPSLLPEFASYGSALLHYASTEINSYDALVTSCVTTGPVASSITSYLHSLVSATTPLCRPAGAESASGAGNSTSAPITPYPTDTPTGTGAGPTITSGSITTTSLLVPTAAAAKASGVFAGAAAVGGILGAVALL